MSQLTRLACRCLTVCLLLFLPVAPIEGVIAQRLAQDPVEQAELERLRRVSQRLLLTLPHPLQIEWLVVEDPSINAGATFGRIFVTTGMLRFARVDDELALILGHELAHITQGHVSRSALNTTLLGLGSQVVNVLSPGIGLIAGQVGQLFLNRYNQEQEREADLVGLRYAAAAGYDPQVGAEIMRRMAEEEPHTATAGFFSSHPSSAERAQTLRQVAAHLSLPSVSAPQVGVSADKRAAAPGRFERDETACRRAKTYFYRALDTKNLRDKARLYRRGLRICPESPRAHFELADAYVRLGQTDRAAEELRETLSYDPTYPQARTRLRSIERRLSWLVQ